MRTAKKPGPGRLGLHLKLVLAGSVTTFVGIVMVSAFLVYQQSSIMRIEVNRSTEAMSYGLIERGRLLADSVATSMENAIAGYNFTFVADSIKGVQQRNSNLAYAYLTNSERQIIIHTEPGRVGESSAPIPPEITTSTRRDHRGRNVVEIYQPIQVGGAAWGTLVLAFDLKTIESRGKLAMLRTEQIMMRATALAIVAAILVTLFGIIVSMFLSRRMLKPIRSLADDAAAIAHGNLDREIRTADTGDEIGFLARQFEAMRVSVKTYIGELVIAKQKAEDATRMEKRLRGQIEEHSKLLEIKVQERTKELREINTRLTEYDRMKSEFLSNVSHELRSPLAAVASAAKIINRYGDENKRSGKRFSAVIMDETDRLGRLINDLLDLAKIEAGRVAWNMERVENSVEIVDHVVSTFRPLADEHKIDLSLDSPASLPAIHVDADRVIQVITNLCSNAMKFTPEGGAIRVGAREAVHQGLASVEITVTDTGPGIPQDELDKVFDRFHQVKVKRDGNKPKGTGLGLAICREVVNHHGGEIWAECVEGGGCHMVFYLPVDKTDRAVATPAMELAPA
ncbi:MAG: HAMP domain-containing protein [Myxococcales bacterium]|jgi:signal transduction histidine kinase|nr:MAG: HAMP domain-containing protein [Myxococcales bacterium]